jgi:hypothetical protein
MLILLEIYFFLLENGNSENRKQRDIYVSDQIIEKMSLLWSLLFRIKFINYSFKELRSLFYALCLYLQKNIEIWCLTLLLKTGNIVHELVTESFTNQKTRLTIVHERLFSINRLVSLVSPISTKRTITS